MVKVYWFLAVIVVFFFSRCATTYEISEESFTQQIGDRYYIDVDSIAKLPEKKTIFTVRADGALYLRGGEELRLKSGWTLKGATGKEELVKEYSTTTSAIKIKDSN